MKSVSRPTGPGGLLLVLALLTAMPVLSADGSDTTRIMVIFHSRTGNTAALAEAVARGAAAVPGVRVTLASVDTVAPGDLAEADGLILGSPTHYGSMSAPMKVFIDAWYDAQVTLFDKVGGAFATGGGRTAGRELVVQALLTAMLNNGMVVVGPLYESWGTFGASAMTAPPDAGVGEDERAEGERLGKRVAEAAKRWAAGAE